MWCRGFGACLVLCALSGCGNAELDLSPSGAAGAPAANAGRGATSGGSAQTGASGTNVGSAANGGSAGGTKPEPCLGVVCDTPPVATCEGASLKSYGTVGSCSNGKCDYPEQLLPCAGGCSGDHCAVAQDICTVSCDAVPRKTCKDEHTLSTRYGMCQGSYCTYLTTEAACPFGCADDKCSADPCANLNCALAPATCKDAHTRTTYGSCNAGTCSDATTDSACPSNNQCRAGVCAACTTDTACGPTCAACGGAAPKCKALGGTSQCVGCLADADCGASARCDSTSNSCITLQSDGAPCAADLDCASKSCGRLCCPTGVRCYCPQPSPGNLLSNPFFDQNIDGWSTLSDGSNSFAWANAAESKADCPFSGSLELTTSVTAGNLSAQLSQCVNLDPASTKSYYFGASMRNGDGSGSGSGKCNLGECSLQWMSGASCASPEGTAPIKLFYADTAWGFSVSGPLVRPAAAASARIACSVRGASASPCVFGFDQLSFTEAPDKY